jgi:hypothetical protein
MANAALRIKPEPGIRGCVLEERCKLDQTHLFSGPVAGVLPVKRLA